MNKNVTILWVVIGLLVVMNLTTVLTIVYRNSERSDDVVVVERAEDGKRSGRGGDVHQMSGRCFRQTMGFTSDQMAVYHAENRAFRAKARAIMVDLNTAKDGLYEVMNNHPADSVEMRSYTDKIGTYYAQLKYETAIFYGRIANVCDAEQKERLKVIFEPMFRSDEPQGVNGRMGDQQRRGRNNKSENTKK